jgi:hypothetical protein
MKKFKWNKIFKVTKEQKNSPYSLFYIPKKTKSKDIKLNFNKKDLCLDIDKFKE